MADPLTAAALGAGALTLASYLNAKFHLRHDISTFLYSRNARSARKYIERRAQQDRMLLYHVLEEHVANLAIAENTFLIFAADGREWTYREFLEDVNKVANWLLAETDLRKGELVALDGLNSPEYLILWLALDAIGVCPSLINHSLTGESLVHCVKLCEARYCLADSQLRERIDPIAPDCPSCKIIYYSPELFASLKFPKTAPPKERRTGIAPDSVKTLLYTSGTTGLPKAVIFAAASELYTGRAMATHLGLRPETRFYTCLPLFHGAAHGLGVSPVLHAGCTLILGTKFSHSTFWPSVTRHKASIIQYVGELCRYLLNAPPSDFDRAHSVQMAWGNGMRPDVWEAFRERFGIPTIHELYAASDGMGATFNANRGEFGAHAIGVRGLLWNVLAGSRERIVEIDIDTQEILRFPTGGSGSGGNGGFARVCKPGEPGEVIHWIDPENPRAQFEGYFKNDTATEKRFIRDVFKKGDMWFRSGDMMRQDREGRVYFVDRLGDTFRWKSENVSTNEVSDLLGKFPSIAECNVYGVLVPHADGRAGCAAIVLADGVVESAFDFKALADHALRVLPRYAVPIFLRVTPALGYTSTMKMQKGKLRLEGCDVALVERAGDKMYWLPPHGVCYVPFTAGDYQKLQGGEVRL
ncbi:hypothetical protein BJY00DRAFT_317637 [Aspergillus carlsbadensis]|nr:hypothetical protein BJY00DRAFT_317637 [Aspergillus carlsbadensis]